MIVLRQTPEGVIVPLDVRPRSSRPGPAGEREGRLRLGVAAPAEDGRANREVVRSVAELFGVSPSAVTIVRGDTARKKEVVLAGLSLRDVQIRIAEILPE